MHFLSHKSLLLILTALWLGIPQLDAEEIWTALIQATQQPEPTTVSNSLKPYEKALHQIFGYNAFRLIGESTQPIKSQEVTWIIPKEELYVRLLCKEAKNEYHVLNLQLYQKEKLLLESDAKMMYSRPLFIRGPQWGGGQLIFLLVLK